MQFEANRIETVNFEGKLSNTGDKSKTEYNGNMKLRTSAYSRLNFASNATWLSLQGHTEGVITYNNVPDAIDPTQTSRLRLVFARSHSEDYVWEGSRTRASVELNIPKSNVDFRILVKLVFLSVISRRCNEFLLDMKSVVKMALNTT